MKTKIGVVIPTYNRVGNLTLLLESLIKQSITDFDVVIADDGSTDDTSELINKLSKTDLWRGRLKWVDCGPNINGRRGRARNIGVANLPSDCTLVIMLDSDLVLESNVLSNYASLSEKHLNDIIFGMVKWLPPIPLSEIDDYVNGDKFSELKRLIPSGIPKLNKGTFVGPELRINAPFTKYDGADYDVKSEWSLFTNTAIPRKLFEKVGGFDENMQGYGYEDMELGARLSKNGTRCIYSSDCLALHIWHSKSNDKLCSIENQINLDYFLRKHGSNKYYENMVDWQYWWHYHKLRQGEIHQTDKKLLAVNASKTKALFLTDSSWISKLGFSESDVIRDKIELKTIEIEGEAIDPVEIQNIKV